jgi:hypothetical protein
MSRSSSGVISPDSTPPVSQAGSWLCQTSTWPRTAWRLSRAKATSSSAGPKFSWPGCGSIVSHFMTFSAVTLLNSVAIRSR